MRLEDPDLTLLARFSRSPDGQVFLRLLRAERASYDATLRKARGEDIFRAQGSANAIDELIKSIERAAAPKPPMPSRRQTFVVDSESESGA